MAVGFDAFTEFPATQSAGVSNTLTLSWNHIPVTSTPRGVGLFVTYALSSLTLVTAVRYGGTALTRRGISRDLTTEPGITEFWYLGAGVPTGTQAFNVVRLTGTAGMWGVGFTVSASFSTTVSQTIVVQENTSLNEKTLSTIGIGVRLAGAYYGGAAPPGVGANSTTVFDIDYGAYAARVVRETTAGSGNRVVGFAAGTADDVAAIYVAIEEEAQPIEATTISANGVASDLVFGTPTLLSRYTVLPTGYGSEEAFGLASVLAGSVSLFPTGKGTDEAFGVPDLIQKTLVFPTGYASDLAFGSLTIQPQGLTVLPSAFDGALSSTFNQAGGFLVWKNQVTATYTVTATVPAGYKFTEFLNPEISVTTNIGYNYSPPLVSGDLVVYREWTTNDGATTSHSVTISPTGYITIDGGASDSYSLSFLYFFWDDSLSAYGSTLTYTLQTVGGGFQTISPNGKASDNAYGIASLTSRIITFPIGKDTDSAFGIASLTSRTSVFPNGKAADTAFGTVSLTSRTTVLPTGKASDAAFGVASLTSRIIVLPTGKASDAAFGLASLTQRTSISPIGKATDAAFGLVSLSARVIVSPNGKATDAAFGTPTIGSFFIITPTGKSSNAAFGIASLTARTILLPVAKASDAAFGQASLQARFVISPTGKGTDQGFGTVSILNRNSVYPNGVPTGAAFGQAAIAQRLFIFPNGLASSAAFGTPFIGSAKNISPTGLVSNEAFGTAILSSRSIITPVSLASTQAFGVFQFGVRSFIYPVSYVRVEAFGTPTFGSVYLLNLNGLASNFTTGSIIFSYDQFVYPSGLSQTEFGQLRISIAGQLVVAGNNIFQWFDTQPNLKGSRIDRIRQYLEALGYAGAINGSLFDWLGYLGYTDTLAEKISKFERDFTNRYGPK